MPDSRSKCLQSCIIHHQVKYWRLNANTSIVAAILFSGHPYIGRHYRASLINTVYMWLVLDQPSGHFGRTLQLHIQVNNNEIHLPLAKKRGQLPL